LISSHHFQCHYAALHDLSPYPYVMPLMPTVVNPYLLSPITLLTHQMMTLMTHFDLPTHINMPPMFSQVPTMPASQLANGRTMKTKNQDHLPPTTPISTRSIPR
jgi:hypothetical protein